MKYFIYTFCLLMPINLLADAESLNLGVNVNASTTPITCTVSADPDKFILSVTGLPVGTTSFVTAIWEGENTCYKTDGVVCNNIVIPVYTVSCNGDKTGTISFSGSSSAISNGKTITVNALKARLADSSDLTSGQSISMSYGDPVDIYLGATFNFPSNLSYSTSYTWTGTITSAVTLNF